MPRKRYEPIIRVVAQREDADCALACLSMLSTSSYEDVLRAVCRIDEDGADEGLYITQIQAAAEELGMRLKKKRRVRLESDHGILHIAFPDQTRHVVILLGGGYLVDTNAFIWTAQDYIRHHRAKVNAVLVPES